MRRYLLALTLALSARAALADGGRLRMKEPAGPFIVTLFTSPDPLVKGPADFSVAIERPNIEGLVQDANVTLTLTPIGGHEEPIVLHASHEAATSRFLQAADFTFPHPGRWRITVAAHQGSSVGECSGEVDVKASFLPSDQLAWEVALVPFAVLLFLVHQWRKKQ